MTSLALVALSGLLGSGHCIGMCGGFAMLVALRRPSHRDNLVAQIIYSLGRLTTYAVLGGAVGCGGKYLSQRTPWAIYAPAVLCLLAGGWLLVEGAKSLGWFRRAATGGTGCSFSPLLASLLRGSSRTHIFSAGLLTGLFPCGLVYAFLTLAASTSDLLQGMATMAAFGLGTMPLMILTGAGSLFLGVAARERLLRAAAWAVLATGALTLQRGVAFLDVTEPNVAARCPYCRDPVAEAMP